MNLTGTKEIAENLAIAFNFSFDRERFQEDLQPQILIPVEKLFIIASYLNQSPSYYFDYLNCITAIDNGIEAQSMDIIYHLTSIPFGRSLILKIQFNRQLNAENSITSLSDIWKTADWHEREIYDFFGVKFSNHPDLRRILLPADWEGHPMRKDYEEQETYHGIKVKY